MAILINKETNLFKNPLEKNPNQRLLAYAKRNIRKWKNNPYKLKEFQVLKDIAINNLRADNKTATIKSFWKW